MEIFGYLIDFLVRKSLPCRYLRTKTAVANRISHPLLYLNFDIYKNRDLNSGFPFDELLPHRDNIHPKFLMLRIMD